MWPHGFFLLLLAEEQCSGGRFLVDFEFCVVICFFLLVEPQSDVVVVQSD